MNKYGTQLRIYDNGGKTLDRYTILPPKGEHESRFKWVEGIGSSDDPYYPQGFGMWITAQPGRHLGKRIHIDDLPKNVRKFAEESFPEYV